VVGGGGGVEAKSTLGIRNFVQYIIYRQYTTTSIW